MPDKTFPNPIKADPSTFSFREGEGVFDLAVENEKDRIFFDKNTGEKFYKIDPDKVKFQKLTSLILKGIINVSDVVKVGNDYYSHIQNLDNLSEREDLVAEIKADILIFSLVFGDYDHVYHETSEDNSTTEHKNLITQEKLKKYYFFNFDKAFMWRGEDLNFGQLKFFFESSLKQKEITSLTLNILTKKVKLLSNLFVAQQFEWFQKIIHRSSVGLSDGSQKFLFADIKLRLRALNEALSDVK